MFYVVTGGSGSGKSAFAEDLICRNHDVSGTGQSGDSLIYIATMVPYGEETKRKIRRHREMRMNKGFSTIECYTGLDALTENVPENWVSPVFCWSACPIWWQTKSTNREEQEMTRLRSYSQE